MKIGIQVEMVDMISIFEIILIQVPFLILLGISLILSGLALKLRQITGEDSLIHLMTTFLFASLLFLSLFLAWLNINNLDLQYWVFSLGIFAFWAVILEMGIFYLAVFISPNKILPSARLYIPAILGAAATISLLRVINNFRQSWKEYSLNIWELVIYIVAVILFIILDTILVRELYRNRQLFKLNPFNMAFMDSVRQIITSGSLVVIYVFVSVVIWFFIKTSDFNGSGSMLLQFSLLIQDFELVDWLVYLNIPILLITFVYISVQMRKLIKIAEKVDINEIYNALT